MENKAAVVPPAIQRLVDLMPMPRIISAPDAAALLGGGEMRLREVMSYVAVGDLVSWTHSPSEGEHRRLIKHKYGTEELLPRVTPDTDPNSVLIDGKDVLRMCCLHFEILIHAPQFPPREAVESRLQYVQELARAQALRGVPATDTAPPAPVVTDSASTDTTPDPERRLARLRALGGKAIYRDGTWKFTGVTELVKIEKSEGRKRFDEQTIRKDLKEAAQNEREEKRANAFGGLGQR